MNKRRQAPNTRAMNHRLPPGPHQSEQGRALSDVPINILQFPRRVSSWPVLVAGFSRSRFDELPELRASWYAKVYKKSPRGFMPDYCDKNEGDMHFIDVGAAVDRQQLEEREHAQHTNDEAEGVDLPVTS